MNHVLSDFNKDCSLIFQFNWYTKRASLAGVYKSTEIYMLQDNSEGHENTWEFLDRRLEDLVSLGKFARNVITYDLYLFCRNLSKLNAL